MFNTRKFSPFLCIFFITKAILIPLKFELDVID